MYYKNVDDFAQAVESKPRKKRKVRKDKGKSRSRRGNARVTDRTDFIICLLNEIQFEISALSARLFEVETALLGDKPSLWSRVKAAFRNDDVIEF